MASKTDRDFQLAGEADAIAAALLCNGDPAAPPLTQGVRLFAREMALRLRDLTFGLMPATLEYAPDMPEDALRRWAADVVKTLRE